MRHKHYDLIVQWAADPDKYEVQWAEKGKFFTATESPAWKEALEYRLVQKRPKPLTEAPPTKSKVYAIDFSDESLVTEMTWFNDMACERRWLGLGILFNTHDEARRAAEIMLAALKEQRP